MFADGLRQHGRDRCIRVVILYLYNGQRAARGKKFSHWFFYLFYPVHLLVLGVIRVMG